MGLFDWLLGTRSPKYVQHRIWLTKQAKLDAIASEITAVLADEANPELLFVAAYFPDCLEELRAMIAERQFDAGRMVVASVDDLKALTNMRDASSCRLCVIVGEVHPLPVHDEPLHDLARRFPERCRILFYVSLDDALLRTFAGEQMQRTLRSLGMKENEAIESRMVSRRIESARRKIADQALGDTPAESAEAWFSSNFRQ
jgi:hypothetical protein